MTNEPAPTNSQTDSQPIEAQATPPAPHAAPDPAPTPEGEAASPPADSLIGGQVEQGEGSEGEEGPPSEPITADDLEIPEGFVFEGEGADAFLALINDPPESRAELANAMIAAHTQILQQTADTYAQQWQETQDAWREEVRQLPEIGGAHLERTLGQIAQVVDRYGDAEVREAFAVTGAGNHPAMVRFLSKIAKDLNEAPPVSGQPAVGEPRDRASRMYGNTAQE